MKVTYTETKVYTQYICDGIKEFGQKKLARQLISTSEDCATEFENKIYQKIVGVLRKTSK